LEDRKKNFSNVENYRNPYRPRTTRHQSESEKGQKKDSTQNSKKTMISNHGRIIPPDGNLHGQQLRNETVMIPRMSIPTGIKLMKALPKRWLKKEREKNDALVAPSTTTLGENVASRL